MADTQLTPANDDPASLAAIVSSLPLWQRRYLASIQSGATPEQARLVANCGNDAIQRWLAKSPAFARAHDALMAGQALFGAELGRDLAQVAMGGLVLDAIDASRTTKAERDRVANRRWISDVSGLTGSGVQVNVGVQVNQVPAQRWELYQRHLARPETQVVDVQGKVVETTDSDVTQDARGDDKQASEAGE